MAVNQIFIEKPPLVLITTILKCIGIRLNTERYFSYRTIEENMSQLNDIFEHKLKPYYLLCKSKIYFKELNPKRCITILRHCVKLYGYKIVSKETYKNKRNILEFKIINTNKPVKICLDFN